MLMTAVETALFVDVKIASISSSTSNLLTFEVSSWRG